MAAVITNTGQTAVICCGNRLYPGDDLGSRVFDCLVDKGMPEGIALIDGGLAGLDLLNLMEGRNRVVLVDALAAGFIADGRLDQPLILAREELAEMAGNYGHGAGLPWLAAIAPDVLDPLPEILLVGAEASDGMIERVVETCIEVALHGHA